MNYTRKFLNMTKAIYDKFTANIILNREKLKAFQNYNKTKDVYFHDSYSI
jgi:hypothetical protein